MTRAMQRAVLLGHPRSGTTLLRRLLGAHEALYAPPETHLFGAAGRFLASERTADGVDLGVLAGLDFAGLGEAEVLRRLRSLVFGLLDDLASAKGASGWIEKTAFDVFHLDAIARLCGDEVRYVGIVRHPLDVAVSCEEFCRAAGLYPATLHQYIQAYPQPIEAFVRSWIDATESLISLGERFPEQCLLCRYEDLVAEPEATVVDIVSFLGLAPATGSVAQALASLEDLGFSDHKSYQVDRVHAESVHRWASLPVPQVERLAPLVNGLLDRCGYEPLPSGPAPTIQESRRRYARSLAVHATSRAS